MNSQREPCIDVRRVFRQQTLHAGIQLIERALALQSRLEAVCFLEGSCDLVDVLLVAENCVGQSSILAERCKVFSSTSLHLCNPTALGSSATAAVYLAASRYVVNSHASSPLPQ